MIAQHTPGPWRQLPGNSRARIVTVEKRHVVADVNSYNVDMDANARLIAAAPDLLAALSAATASVKADRAALFESHVNPTTGIVDDEHGAPALAELDAVLARCHAALAKATGSAA